MIWQHSSNSLPLVFGLGLVKIYSYFLNSIFFMLLLVLKPF